MSGPVEHHANTVLSSFSPGSWPNPIKLISMRCFFTNGKAAVRDNPNAGLCATGKHHCQVSFLMEKGEICSCSLQERKSQLCSLDLLLLGDNSREDLTVTTEIKMILLVHCTETLTCRSPFIICNF